MIENDWKWWKIWYNTTMIMEERLDLIRKALEKNEKVSNKALLEVLDISESTLRRDLDHLEERGEIKRVHGGAILDKISQESDFTVNRSTNIKEKSIIAKKAAALIKDNSYIFLDAGTTTNQLIDFIANKNLTVVTNGLMHIERLKANNIKSILLGGTIKERTFVTYGEITLSEISSLYFDIAFIGANGINDKGYWTADINEALIKRTAIKNARKSYILADSSKIGRNYFAKICNIDQADLITEDIWFTHLLLIHLLIM